LPLPLPLRTKNQSPSEPTEVVEDQDRGDVMYHPTLHNLLAEPHIEELRQLHQTQTRRPAGPDPDGAVWKACTARLAAYLERFVGPAPPAAPAF
jgi:hypothetical protein